MEKNCLNCKCSYIIKDHYTGYDMMSCRNESGAGDCAFRIPVEEAKTYCCENYSGRIMEKNCLNCICGTRIKHKDGDVISCYTEPGASDHAFCISVTEAGNHCCENFRDKPEVYELPAQTELPNVISVPRAEMCSNALLFYDAFRGLCKLRIGYAEQVIEAAIADCDAYWTEEKAEALEKTEMFWTKVQDYWKAKLELSYKWEKDYFGRK